MASDSRPPPAKPLTYHTINIEELTDALNERARLYTQIKELQQHANKQLNEIRRLSGSPAYDAPLPSVDRAALQNFLNRLSSTRTHALMSDLDGHVRDVKSEEASKINNEGINAQLDYLTEKLGKETVQSMLREFDKCGSIS